MNTRQTLLNLLCQIQDPTDMHRVLESLLSDKELTGLQKRLQIFQLIADGKPQREIAAQLGTGIATVTRGARAYRDNPKLQSLFTKST